MQISLNLFDGWHVGPLFIPRLKKPKILKRKCGWDEFPARMALATPPWVDYSEVRAFWLASRVATEMTGIQHSVDHTVPLRHPLVCGLNVPWNLCVIPLEENRLKGNNTWPDMWNEQMELL